MKDKKEQDKFEKELEVLTSRSKDRLYSYSNESGIGARMDRQTDGTEQEVQRQTDTHVIAVVRVGGITVFSTSGAGGVRNPCRRLRRPLLYVSHISHIRKSPA